MIYSENIQTPGPSKISDNLGYSNIMHAQTAQANSRNTPSAQSARGAKLVKSKFMSKFLVDSKYKPRVSETPSLISKRPVI